MTGPRWQWAKTAMIATTAGTAIFLAAFAKSPAEVSSIPPPPAVAVSTGPLTATARLDRSSVLVGGDGLVRMELNLQAQQTGANTAAATDLMVVLDRSGSMRGKNMQHARSAVHALLAQLGPDDRFGLVTYSDRASLPIDLSRATPQARRQWGKTVDRIYCAGGTNMSQGLDLALQQVERAQLAGRFARVILISDGHANAGETSLPSLSHRAQRAMRGEYVLSTVGVGVNFNEHLMNHLADVGTGNYYFVDRGDRLAEVFQAEFQSARETVARGLEVQLKPAPGVVVTGAAGYPLQTVGDTVVFRPGAMWAGQQLQLWVTYRVPTQHRAQHNLGSVAVSYSDHQRSHLVQLQALPQIACLADRHKVYATVNKSAWEKSVIVEQYNELQQQVAELVRTGQRQAAVDRIDYYQASNRSLNQHIQSLQVDNNLGQAEDLKQQVEQAFAGDNQEMKQNMLSKNRGYQARNARRQGSARLNLGK